MSRENISCPDCAAEVNEGNREVAVLTKYGSLIPWSVSYCHWCDTWFKDKIEVNL